jgi:glutathione S-transferase
VASEPTLYVISGSHACATAKLSLAHKRVRFRTVTLRTGPHPLLVRLHGFPGHHPVRLQGEPAPAMSRLMERLGTVPAVAFEDEKVQTNMALTRCLERRISDPPLLPADPEKRQLVEQAERWGDAHLQMLSRRLALAAGARDLDELSARGASGRLGALLAGDAAQRSISGTIAGRFVFRATGEREADLLRELPAALDRIDGLVAGGVLNGSELNAADMMIAPSFALLDYRLDLREELRARPSFALVERLLPEPPA